MESLEDLLGLRFLVPGIVSSIAGYVFFTSPFVLYLLARWRAHRDPAMDPQLGLKVALGYLASLGMQLALIGGAIILYAVITKNTDDRGQIARVGFGFLVPAILVYAGHRVALGYTNQADYPAVRRLVAGYNLLLVGAIGLVAFVGTFQALFAKGSSGEGGRFIVAVLLVYLPAWGFHGLRVFLDRTELKLPAAPVPRPTETFAAVAPPSIPTAGSPPASPGASSTGLPSLGGGSFPPLKE